MIRYTLKRLLWMIPVILGVAILIFTLMYFTPGDPARTILGNEATQEEIMQLRDELGLNDSYPVQLGRFLYQTFIKFDFGTSYFSKKSVGAELAIRLPITMKICYMGILIATVIGIPLGVLSAINRNNWKDGLITFLAMFGASLPSFWFALIMTMYLAVKWRLLPIIFDGSLKGYLMPWISIAIGGIASTARQTRSSMLEVIRQDYITTARAKGEPEFKVICVHALKNAMIPVITSIGGTCGILFGVTLVAETVFSAPGVGTYLLNAINTRDYPVVRGGVLVLGIIFGLTMLVVDLLYAAVDPRMRDKFGKK